MKKLKLFDEYSFKETDKNNPIDMKAEESTFETEKINLRRELYKVILKYNGFSKSINQKDVKIANENIESLKKIIEDIDKFKEK